MDLARWCSSGRRDNAMNAVNPYQEFQYEIVIAGES
jgi:hypothetical protein